MRTVHLYGDLKERFGTGYRFDVATVGECIKAMSVNFAGFREYIRPGRFQIVRGEDIECEQLTEEQLDMNLGDKDLHIVPVIEGDKSSKGIISIVLGVVLIAAACVFAPFGAGLASSMGGSIITSGGLALGSFGTISWSSMLLSGALMAVSGVSNLLTPDPTVDTYDTREDEPASNLFNGAINRMEQGGAIPLVYGRFRIGSQLVSAGVTINETA